MSFKSTTYGFIVIVCAMHMLYFDMIGNSTMSWVAAFTFLVATGCMCVADRQEAKKGPRVDLTVNNYSGSTVEVVEHPDNT